MLSHKDDLCKVVAVPVRDTQFRDLHTTSVPCSNCDRFRSRVLSLEPQLAKVPDLANRRIVHDDAIGAPKVSS